MLSFNVICLISRKNNRLARGAQLTCYFRIAGEIPSLISTIKTMNIGFPIAFIACSVTLRMIAVSALNSRPPVSMNVISLPWQFRIRDNTIARWFPAYPQRLRYAIRQCD
jgi:hypothetical protein